MHLGHRLDQGFRPAGETDPPAGHGVGLGDPVDGDNPLRQIRRGVQKGGKFKAVINQVFVNIIAHDVNAGVFSQHIAERRQLAFGIGGPGRVGGRVHDQPLGFGRDRRVQIGRLQLEGIFNCGLDYRRNAAGQQHHIRIRHPVRGRDQHLVTRIEGRHQRVIDGLLGAGIDRDLAGGKIKIVVAFEFQGDRLLALDGAVDGGVLGLAVLDRPDARFLDMIGGIEIRLADAQADHILASGFQFGHQALQLEPRRGFDFAQVFR